MHDTVLQILKRIYIKLGGSSSDIIGDRTFAPVLEKMIGLINPSGGGAVYTAGPNIYISAENVISNTAPELLKFVDTLPQTNIDENAYYLTLAAKYYPTLDEFLTSSAISDYPLVCVTNSNGAWRCMRAKKNNIFKHTGDNLPASIEYIIYGITETNEWEQIYSGTNTDWSTYMGILNGYTVGNIYYANKSLKNEALSTRYDISNNRTDKDGYLIDPTQANPYQWTVNQYVNGAWVERGVSDFEELFNTVNVKVLTDYATTATMNTALALKADTATTYTKTEVNTLLDGKQNLLTAGTGISIVNNVISASSIHQYSTNEQIVGYWVNGKPIYEKTVPFTLDSNGCWYSNAESGGEVFPNVAQCLDIKGYVNLDDVMDEYSGTAFINTDYSESGTKQNLLKSYFLYDSDAEIYGLYIISITGAAVEFPFNGKSGYVTLQYTKTTD